jgi:hypothetical protein
MGHPRNCSLVVGIDGCRSGFMLFMVKGLVFRA